MTTTLDRRATATRDVGGARRRLDRLLRTEARLLWRFQAVTAVAAVTVVWIVVLWVVPADIREVVAPMVLLTDVAALGFLFVPALLVVERVEGVEAALRMTPVRPAERVVVRLGLTTALAVAAGLAVCLAVGLSDIAPRLAGVTLLSVLFGLVAFALTGGATTLTSFLTRAPLLAAPLIAPALAHMVGVTSPALYLSPVTAAVELLRGNGSWIGIVWQLLWIVAAAAAVATITRRPLHVPTGSSSSPPTGVAPPSRWPAHSGAYRTAAAVRSFARVDRRTLVRDGLLVMLVASVPLLTVVLRLVGSVGADWTQRRYGIALGPHLPLIEALLLVVHTPMVFGSLAGLLLLEDRDAGLFGPLTATRAGLRTLLIYRLGATAAITTVTLGVMLPLDGVSHPAGLAGTTATAIAAGAVSVVPALLMAAVATNRVHGVAVMKMLGLPLYLPLAGWVLTGSARWLFAPLPTAWATWAGWATTPTAAAVAATGAAVVSAACAVPLARRALRRACSG